jgi:hypothetical protein
MLSLWQMAVLVFLYIAIHIAWTLLVRTFPDIIGGTWLKNIERRNAIDVERVKDELTKKTQSDIERLRAEHANLKTAVDFMSASQGEVRLKMIESSDRLWNILLKLRQKFGPVMYIDAIFMAKEIVASFRGEKFPGITKNVVDFQQYDAAASRLSNTGANEAEKDRLFVSAKLWSIFYIMRAFYGRTGVLIHFSFEKKEFQDWRQDELLTSILGNALPADVVQTAKALPSQGLQTLIGHLENEFLVEAVRVMSGVHSFSESISQLNLALTVDKEKAVDERSNLLAGKA